MALLATAFLFTTLAVQAADEFYPTVVVGPDIYTNVTVLNKTRSDIFVRHAHGMANIKVKDLDLETQVKLGYQVAPPPPTRMERVFQNPNITELESNSKVQEFEELILARSGDLFERLDEQMTNSIVAFIILVYLLFCFLCRCICVKTSNPPSPLIWLPWVKQIPLFKAAGMSPAWILSSLVPPLFLLAYIIWCFRIVRARAKKTIYSVMLLLPGTNLLAFLYLALSCSGAEEEKPKSSIINLGPQPRREVA